MRYEKPSRPSKGNAFIKLMGGLIVCIGCSTDEGTPPVQRPTPPGSGSNVRPQEEKLPFHEDMNLEKDVIKRLYKICDNFATKKLISRKLADYCQENIKREYDKIMNNDLLAELTLEEKKAIHEALVHSLGIEGEEPFLDRPQLAQVQALELAAAKWVCFHTFEKIKDSITSKAKATHDALLAKDVPKARALIRSSSDELRFIANAKIEDPRIRELIQQECKKAGIDYPAEGFIIDALDDLRDASFESVRESVETLEKLIKSVPDA